MVKIIMSRFASQPKPDYYQAAKSWYQENYESVACARNAYRLSTLFLAVLLLSALIAISIMLPLKRYYYRILTLNQQTGEVTVLKEVEENQYAINWIMTRYFIAQYVEARESYSYEDIKRQFNHVLTMSDRTIADSYMAKIMATNVNSPINVLKNDYYREVDILGVDKLNEQTALVRFNVTTINKMDVNDKKTKDWHVVVRWKYVNAKESLANRDQNPLGFKITYYQLSPVFTEKQ